MIRPLLRNFIRLCLIAVSANAQQIVDEVDPFIGTSYGAHNFPGAIVPWGMVSLSPHTDLNDPSGYYWNEVNSVDGFGHVHLSGVGCHDLANIVLMPTRDSIITDHKEFRSILRDETASPGFYSGRLERYGINVELTATERAGFSRYVFAHPSNAANILIDVTQGVTPSLGAYVEVVSDSEVQGFNTSGRFCKSPTHQKIHFVARFSQSFTSFKTWSNSALTNDSTAEGKSIGAALRFSVRKYDTILVKVGIS
ncbi:MAG: glycoside hydrolase family 92 protein, partial [bacterium]|nr:glycoside hydrolase family 92 protein [Candidatus Kapabacteria bacterium]